MKLHLKEFIDGYQPIPNNLSDKSFADILLSKLKPYEDVFLQIYDQLPKNSQKTYLKYFNQYKQDFTDIGQKIDAKYVGATYDPNMVYTKMERSSPQDWERWRRSIMGSAYSTDFLVNVYVVEMSSSKYDVSYILFRDGSATFGVPTDNKSWQSDVDEYVTVQFFSITDAEKFAQHFHLTNYKIKKMRKAYKWTRDNHGLFSQYRLLDNKYPATFVMGVPVICGSYYHPNPQIDNSIGFVDFTQQYDTRVNEKANIRTMILNPISKKYNFEITRSDAGDEYYNTEYSFRDSTGKYIFDLTYYSRGPWDNPAKYSIQMWFDIPDVEETKAYRKDTYNYGGAEMEFWLDEYNRDLVNMMKMAKQAIEVRLDNYYNNPDNSTQTLESYDTDNDEWEEVQDYAIGFTEEDGEEYEDGAYFTILYNPKTKQYSWSSSIEFEPDGTFNTFNDAYNDAFEAHTPDDGSELYTYEV